MYSQGDKHFDDTRGNNILSSSSTFMLDSDAALQLCIETLLLQNANTNHVEDDSAEYSEKQPHSTLLARALEIIPLLKSTKDLVTSLSGILYKVKNKLKKKKTKEKNPHQNKEKESLKYASSLRCHLNDRLRIPQKFGKVIFFQFC